MTAQRKQARTGPPVIDRYARISHSTDDTRGSSLEGQIEDGRHDIVERGGVVGQVFPDESKSAWNPTVNRPELVNLTPTAWVKGGTVKNREAVSLPCTPRGPRGRLDTRAGGRRPADRLLRLATRAP